MDKLHWTAEEQELIYALYPKAPRAEVYKLMLLSEKAGLDPLLNQSQLILRRNKDGDEWVDSWQVLFGRDAYLIVADRSGNFDGIEVTYEVNDKQVLVSATATVWRKDANHSFRVQVYLNEYKGTAFIWNTKPRTMLGKVAEAQALRRAFPNLLVGTYIPEEFEQSPAPEPEREPASNCWLDTKENQQKVKDFLLKNKMDTVTATNLIKSWTEQQLPNKEAVIGMARAAIEALNAFDKTPQEPAAESWLSKPENTQQVMSYLVKAGMPETMAGEIIQVWLGKNLPSEEATIGAAQAMVNMMKAWYINLDKALESIAISLEEAHNLLGTKSRKDWLAWQDVKTGRLIPIQQVVDRIEQAADEAASSSVR